MINIETNFKYVNDILAKNSGEGVFPDEYTRNANVSQKEYFKLVLGSNNRTVNGQSRVVYGRNQILDARLVPFKESVLLNVVDGVVTIPSDCAHIRSIRTLSNEALRRIDDDRIGMINSDPLSHRTYYFEKKGEVEVFSDQPLIKVRLDYLKYPKDIKYAYTTNGRGRPVFDPINSVDFEWNETEEVELTTRILQRFGVEFRDGHIQNYTNIQKSQE